jgi:tetratricopeptide (TPR) repeat protein
MSQNTSVFRVTSALLLYVFSISNSFGQKIPSAFFEKGTTDSEKIACLKRINWDGASKTDSLDALLDEGIPLAAENNEPKLENKLKLKQIQFSNKTLDEKIASLIAIQEIAKKQDWDSIYLVSEHVICQSLKNNDKSDEALKRWLVLLEDERIKRGNFPYLQGSIFIEMASIYDVRGNYQEALAMYQASLKTATKSKNWIRIGNLYHGMGVLYSYLSQKDSSRKYIDKAIALAIEINEPGMLTRAYNSIARSFGMAGKYDSCLVYSLLLEKTAKKYRFTNYIFYSYDMIAACYMSLKNPKKALPYQLKAYEMVNSPELLNNSTNKCYEALNVGLCYIELKEYDNAEKYYLEALAIGKNINTRERANVLMHLGFLYLDQGNLRKAKTYCSQLEEVLPKVTEPFLTGEIQRCLAQYNNETNQNQKSNVFANGAISNITSFENLAKVYQIKALNHEALSEYDSAIIAYRLYILNQDSFQRQSDKELEHTILAKYSVEKAENRAKIATMDKELSDLNTEKERRMKLFGFLLLGLSLVSILIIVSRHKKFLAERDKTMQLEKEAAQAVLDKSLSVLTSQSELILNKNRLINELKNNLTTLFNDVAVDASGMNTFLDTKILTKEDWNKFKISFAVVHPTFITRANELYPNLTASELRLLCLQKLGMNTQESADMLGVLHDSVKRTTLRIFQKFNIDSLLTLQEVVDGIQ